MPEIYTTSNSKSSKMTEAQVEVFEDYALAKKRVAQLLKSCKYNVASLRNLLTSGKKANSRLETSSSRGNTVATSKSVEDKSGKVKSSNGDSKYKSNGSNSIQSQDDVTIENEEIRRSTRIRK